jgi:archaellum biogenesis ATPase FlaH
MSEYVVGKNPCKRCRQKSGDHAGNNFHWYGEGLGGHCFSCGFSVPSDSFKAENGMNDKYEYEDNEVMTKEIITAEEMADIKEYTGTQGYDERGISDETYKAYACRFKYSEESGEVSEVFYPYTQDYKAAGYKVRKTPVKDFYSVGKIGKQSELFGQWKWKDHSAKYVLLCAGELDAMSAFQMLESYRKTKGTDYDATPVVSSAIGESGSYKQVQLQYNWLNQAQRVIVCYDNDEAGRAAIKKLVDVIPKGKMFVMNLSLKDANEYLVKGKEKMFLRAFFDAPAYSPDGILGSGGLGQAVRMAAETPKIPLPPFMHRVQKQMAGGIPLGVIVNLGSASGTGKSTFSDEIIYFLIFNSPHKVGVLSLESDAGNYGTKVLSRHVGRKIDLIESVEEKLAYLDSPEVLAKEETLWKMPDGTDRWYLIDDRDGGIESVKKLIMELVIACGCKLILIDPLQDLTDGLTNDEQAVFQRWMKGLTKSHGVTFLNINHTRKTPSGGKQGSTGADLHEEDFQGSSSIFKSAACNLLFSRNKEAEDVVEKNTTLMKMTKCRWTGSTGMSGEYYYDNDSHCLHDKLDWLKEHPAEF